MHCEATLSIRSKIQRYAKYLDKNYSSSVVSIQVHFTRLSSIRIKYSNGNRYRRGGLFLYDIDKINVESFKTLEELTGRTKSE